MSGHGTRRRRDQESSSSPEALKSHDISEIDLPEAKRAKTNTANSVELKPGAIVRIRMQNFMTYDDISYDFGPALNMIIGPNGSGKSTVVAGICLGLGFDPKIMGRADKVEATIKHGMQNAKIEIELKGHQVNKNIVVMRNFGHGQNGGKGMNDWFVNGKRSTQKNVQELVRSFNCQIDNLCQFLPQDKVASFARMKPVEMLAATLRTIGDGSLGELHSTLIDLQTKFDSESTTRKTDEDHLKGLKARQEILERDVARFKERESMQKEIYIREKRLPFAMYNEAKEAHAEAKRRYNDAKALLLVLRRNNQPLEQQDNSLAEHLLHTRKQVSKAKQRLDSAMRKVEALAPRLAKIEDEMTGLSNRFKQERDAEKNNRARVRELRERIARETRSLGDEPQVAEDIADLIQRLKELNASDRAERNECDELEQFLRNQRNERSRREDELAGKEVEIASLNDVRSHRLRLLKSRNPDAADAVQWLQDNQDKFEHRVYDPVLLEVQVTNKKYAKAAQHVIMQNAFTFTCQSRKDYQTFNRLLVDGKYAGRRLRLNVVEWSKTSAPHLRDQRGVLTSNEVKDLGLDGGYLLDCLDGPEPVLNTLCHSAQVHNLPIGTQELSQSDIQLVESASKNNRAAFQRYILNNTDTKIFRGYGQISSESQVMHNDGSIFGHVVDIAKKKSLEHEIEEIRETLDSDVADLKEKKSRWDALKDDLKQSEAKKLALNNSRNELVKRKSSWQSAKVKLEQNEAELERLQNSPAVYQDNMTTIKTQQLEKTKHYTELVIEYKVC